MGATALSVVQYGIETTPGTAVAALHILPGEAKFNLKRKYDAPKERRAFYDEFYENQQLLTQMVEWSFKGEYYPEAMAGLLMACIQASPTVVNTGISAPNPAYNTWTITPDSSALKTFTLEEYDGTTSWQYPYCTVTKLELDYTAEKALEISLTGFAYDQVVMGTQNTKAVTALTMDTTPDVPLLGPQASVTIDAQGGSIGTTANADLMSFKYTLDCTQKELFTAQNTSKFARTYRDYRKGIVDMELDFPLNTEYLQFRASNYRWFQTVIQGAPLGSGANKNEKMTINLPLRYDSWEQDKSKEHVVAKVKGTQNYDASLGYSHQIILQMLATTAVY